MTTKYKYCIRAIDFDDCVKIDETGYLFDNADDAITVFLKMRYDKECLAEYDFPSVIQLYRFPVNDNGIVVCSYDFPMIAQYCFT